MGFRGIIRHRRIATVGRLIRRLWPTDDAPTLHGVQFTWAGGAFAAMVVLIGAAAINTETNLLLLVFGAGLGTLFVSAWITRRNIRELRVARTVPLTATAGQPLVIRYRVENQRRWSRAFSLNLLDIGLLGRTGTSKSGKSSNGFAPEAYVRVIEPAQSAATEATVHVARRGRLTLDAIRVASRFPLSLFADHHAQYLADELLIYPALGRLRGDPWPPVNASDPGEGGTNLSSRGTSEFYGLRDYRHGDSLRWIHWRRSARTGELVTREMTDAQPDQVLVVLDTHLHRAEQDDLREEAIRLAATLCDDGLRRGRQVGLIATGNPWVAVPPAAGNLQASRLMRELSLLSGDVADPVGAVKQLRWNVTWREMPCVFVAVVDDERTRALSADLARRGMNVTRLVAGTSQFDALFDGGSATTDGDRA